MAEADATRTKDDARPNYAAMDAKKAKLNAEKTKHAALKAIRAALGDTKKATTYGNNSTEPPISQVTLPPDTNTSRHSPKTTISQLHRVTQNNLHQIAV